MIRHLSFEELVKLNSFLILRYSPGESVGVKDKHLLESALARPKHTLLKKDAYTTIYSKAAALFESIIQNHPFYNANKRTGYSALVMFLKLNGYSFIATEKNAEDLTVYVVTDKPSIEEITEWIKQNSILD